MNHNVKIEINGTVVDVPVADAPHALRVSLAGGATPIPPVDLPMIEPFVALFVVEDGLYDGFVQAIRADGTLIGNPITFPVSAAPSTVQAFVPASVTVTVTPA